VESKNLLTERPSSNVLSIANDLRDGILGWLKKMNPEQMTYRSSGDLVTLPVPFSKK
jgi:hypothetical protein